MRMRMWMSIPRAHSVLRRLRRCMPRCSSRARMATTLRRSFRAGRAVRLASAYCTDTSTSTAVALFVEFLVASLPHIPSDQSYMPYIWSELAMGSGLPALIMTIGDHG